MGTGIHRFQAARHHGRAARSRSRALRHESASRLSGIFFGNGKFLTRRLWGIANQHPFGHHGMYTTMREAVLAHHGEAEDAGVAFRRLGKYDQDSVIEFLKSLQIVPDRKRSREVSE